MSMSYVNIFETKGLEYLLVISFLIGFIYFVRRLSYSRPATAPAETPESTKTAANPDMVCPAGADCPYEPRTSGNAWPLRRRTRRPPLSRSRTSQGRFAAAGVESAGYV